MSAPTSSDQVDLNYIKSPPGILKIVEFILLIIAFSCLADTNANSSRYHFFLFVTVTLWLTVIILFALFVTKLHEKVNVPWVILLTIFHGVACMGLLIASSLIADTASALHRYRYSAYDYCDYFTFCGKFDAAAAFGFFSLIAFALDCAFYAWKLFRNNQSPASQSVDKPSDEPAKPEALP